MLQCLACSALRTGMYGLSQQSVFLAATSNCVSQQRKCAVTITYTCVINQQSYCNGSCANIAASDRHTSVVQLAVLILSPQGSAYPNTRGLYEIGSAAAVMMLLLVLLC
jgi:hypothetical protein